MIPSKKSQSAMEFLSTHLWALLIVVIMIVALSFYVLPGVLTPSKVTLSDKRINIELTGSNTLLVVNKGEELLQNFQFNLSGYGCRPSAAIDLYPDDPHVLLLLCDFLPLQGTLSGDFDITYTHTVEGNTIDKVVRGHLSEKGTYFNTKGLVRYWSFESTTDSYNYIIYPGENSEVAYEQGVLHNGVLFNGKSYANTTLPDLFNNLDSKEFTLSFFMKGNDLRNYGTWTRIFDARKDSDNFVQIPIHIINRLQIVVWVNGEKHAVAVNSPLQEQTWYHVVATWQPVTQTLQLYLNGALQNYVGDEGTGTSGSDNWLFWGSRSDQNGQFQGSIDEAMLFDRTLTQEEIRSIYTAIR